VARLPCLRAAADVPASLLENLALVVERFLPELEGGLYHIHMYQFLGDGERCARLQSHEPVSTRTSAV
jgi:hypothetical protein